MSLFKGVGQLLDYTFNSLDLSSGTNDIIIVRHPDGSLHSSPFNVRFGILKAPRSREKIVRLEVNGTLIPDTYMKIGEGGVAYWLVPKPSGRIPSDFLSSPPRSPKEGDPSLNNGSGSYSVVSAPISPPPEETTGCNIAFGETHCHEGSLSRNPAQNDSSGFSDSQQKKSCPQTALSDCPKHFAGVEMTHEILDQVDASLAREHSLLEMHQHLVVANTVSSENESIPKPFEPLHLCSEPSAWEADPPIMKPLPLENSSENLSIPILPIPATEDEYVDDDEVSNDFDDDTEEHGMWMISVTPLPEYLERMKLRAGKNVLRFILHSNLLGTQAVTAYAFLCEPDQKLVVSDVDGTITRSDVLGHILPTIGKDWTHDGLCDFYNSIAKNGYQLIYLTARSISQAEMTRNFLHSIVQKGLRLPEGPLLSAPDRIFTAFTRELITKTPHEFKIACLSSIRKAFPCNIHPFYAGLGNRVGDVIAYTAVGIPTHKVLIIDKRSTVHICNTSTSYASLAQLINEGFPANRKVKWEEYNAMYYWNSDPINYFQPGSEAGKSSSLQNRVTCHKTRAKSLLSSMTGNTASNPDFSGKRHACFVELDKFYLVRNLRTDCVLSVENGRAENKTWVKLVRLPKTSLETSLICPRHLWKFEAVASATASFEMAVQSANSGNPTKGTFSSPLNAIVSGVGNSGLLESPDTSPSIKCSGTVRYYVLRNVHTNKILNVSKGGTESGTRVWLHSNAVSAHSHFSLPVISRPLQRVRIVNKNSMRCLAPEQSTDLDHDLLNVHVSAPGYSSTYLAASWTNRQGPKQSEKVSLPAEKSVSVHGNDGTAQSFECSGDTSCERHHSSPSLHVCQTVREVDASSDDTSITWALQAVEDACVARSGHSCDSHVEIRKKHS